jgi:hypothetical protein
MFDALTILLPSLSADVPLEIRQRESAFGANDERVAHIEGLPFARVHPTKTSDGLEILSAAGQANEAARNNETWSRFLVAIVLVLDAHAGWRVICESDCDQHPIEERQLSAMELSQVLDCYRNSRRGPIALHASAP